MGKIKSRFGQTLAVTAVRRNCTAVISNCTVHTAHAYCSAATFIISRSRDLRKFSDSILGSRGVRVLRTISSGIVYKDYLAADYRRTSVNACRLFRANLFLRFTMRPFLPWSDFLLSGVSISKLLSGSIEGFAPTDFCVPGVGSFLKMLVTFHVLSSLQKAMSKKEPTSC